MCNFFFSFSILLILSTFICLPLPVGPTLDVYLFFHLLGVPDCDDDGDGDGDGDEGDGDNGDGDGYDDWDGDDGGGDDD